MEVIEIVLLVCLLLLLLGGGCGIWWHSCKSDRRVVKSKFNRPRHEPWYQDIPDDHPEVKELERETREQAARVKKYTSTKGVKLGKTPRDVQEYLVSVNETVDRVAEGSNNIFRRTSSGAPPYILPIPEDRRTWIKERLKPLLEEWSGHKLEATSAYGPREYRRGSSLRNHVDIENTHVISVILHIGSENLDEPWYLHLYDHDGKFHKVSMEPGDMVYYQSNNVIHGRPDPLKGDYYTNMFVHYKIVDE